MSRRLDWMTRWKLRSLRRADLTLFRASTLLVEHVEDPEARRVLNTVSEIAWSSAVLLELRLPRPHRAVPAGAGRTFAFAVRMASKIGDGAALRLVEWAVVRQIQRAIDASKMLRNPHYHLVRHQVLPAYEQARRALVHYRQHPAPRPAELPETA